MAPISHWSITNNDWYDKCHYTKKIIFRTIHLYIIKYMILLIHKIPQKGEGEEFKISSRTTQRWKYQDS